MPDGMRGATSCPENSMAGNFKKKNQHIRNEEQFYPKCRQGLD